MKHLFTLLLFCAAITVFGQPALEYSISFPNAVHHEAEVSLTVTAAPQGEVIFRMSRSSPGRYATHEFGKNVYNVKASAKGEALVVSKIEGDVYSVKHAGGDLVITYTVFGNHTDGTYLSIDDTHAHLNMPATFMWLPAMVDRPIELTINDLATYKWKVSTQLFPQSANRFSARDLQYFMDSPVELSDHEITSWKVRNSDGREQTVRLAMHALDATQTIGRFSEMVQKIVEESAAIFGEYPQFDGGTYTFLHDVSSENAPDGMEHRNSTVITDRDERVAGNEADMLSTFAHEFVHIWNVERIRPQSLEPFDFSQANLSSDLWFAEGFTQYYGNLVKKRAGFYSDEEYYNILAGMINTVLNSPGPARYSAPEMSERAVFVDAGVAVDQTNYGNIFTSYYTYGAAIALALDLKLRSEFGRTLDDYMRAVWLVHGKPELPYTNRDLQSVLVSITNGGFAENFFRSYINGTEKNDYRRLLEFAGLQLRQSFPGRAWIGNARLVFEPYTGKNRVSTATQINSPLYDAGVDVGDYLIIIGDRQLSGNVDLHKLAEEFKPGQSVPVVFESKGRRKTATIRLAENPTLEIVPIGSNRQQADFRSAWLSSKVKK